MKESIYQLSHIYDQLLQRTYVGKENTSHHRSINRQSGSDDQSKEVSLHSQMFILITGKASFIAHHTHNKYILTVPNKIYSKHLKLYEKKKISFENKEFGLSYNMKQVLTLFLISIPEQF